MNIQGVVGRVEEQAASQLIARADEHLKGDPAEGFVGQLLAGTSPEDLVGYEPDELAALGRQAFAFFAERKPGNPKIRVTNPDSPDTWPRSKGITVIEIVNDDMPFLVDSVMAELTGREVEIRLVAHPVFTVSRSPSGALQKILPAREEGGARESCIYIHVERIEDEATHAKIAEEVERSLADVRAATSDWRQMLARVGDLIASLKASPPPYPGDEISEATQFLEWLVGENFTFLGVREHRLNPAKGLLEAVPQTGLGVLRDIDVEELTSIAGREVIAREIEAFYREPKVLMISKASIRSRVHRRVFMDYVAVKIFDRAGDPVGELRIVGLFTSTAFTRSTRTIPYVRRKVERIMTRAGFSATGHSGKALANVLETYPREELFRIDDETLYSFATAIVQLEDRPRVRVLARRDRFGRFVSLLVYVPRDRASSAVLEAIGQGLAAIYKGRIGGVNLFFPEGPLVRIHFIITRSLNEEPDPDRGTLEYAVSTIIRTWQDALSEQLALASEPGGAGALFDRYRDAFPAGYRERYAPSVAIDDIRTIEGLSAERPLAVEFYAPVNGGRSAAGLKVWSFGRPIPLSERVPVLENMGFRVVDESTFDIAVSSGEVTGVWLHDMMLERADGGALDLRQLKRVLESCFLVVMRGVAENDGYNALVLGAGLWWRDIALVRAISRYLRQIRVPFSQGYLWSTMRRHAGLAAQIVALFHARFDPRLELSKEERAAKEDELVAQIETALNAVESLDEDRIVRHFVNAVRSAIRTNYFQVDDSGQPKALISIKFDSRKIEGLPLPRPLYEIFVYSPRVEGVHLRFGKVARGGIRWSDRPQDFRTEILGLVKAQQVKNAVIVPVGAKGGFVPKQMPAGAPREVVAAEGVATYKLFIGSLLDLTDNIVDDKIVPPDNVVRHDGDDPYFVVAADKGTATFSDIANAISLERDFWLGDAFASGGSAGYDHKKMGITARGAWEAVKRHFREMDVDIARTPFTVAGVGDMSGDVFGNGMLLEKKTIKLVAAFDHRDIFIDPNPDPEKSWAERARLFALPRSSWQDYDRALISAGGGVFPRSSKEIALSAEMRALLDLTAATATPQQLIKAILKGPVDLLWFGGIGTYIRSADETDESVGDRANDAIRVTAAELKCRVIGEGANLGVTQLGRIEAGMRGVRLNTDAIDNSAGVNTSDVEVNIKIALSPLMRSGTLPLADRDKLLVAMTDDVARLVLRNNYLQPLAISLTQQRGLEDMGFQQRLMQVLEKRGLLDRAVEFLPDDMAMAERRRRSQPLTRPELAVLLAYAKLTLYSDLLDSKVPDDPYLARELMRYFPKLMVERYSEAIEKHRLRREIIATQLANSLINRGGPSLIVRMADETGAAADAIATAFSAVRDSYEMTALNGEIDDLDNKIDGGLQLELYGAVQDLLLDRLIWFLRNADLAKGLAAIVAHYRKGIAEIEHSLEEALPLTSVEAMAARAGTLAEGGVPEPLARKIAALPALSAATDVIMVADRCSRPVEDAAMTYFAARDFFRLDRIEAAAREIATSDYFDRLALDRARDTLGEAMRRLTIGMLPGDKRGKEAVEAWVATRQSEVERIRASMHEIAASGLTLSKLSVAASLLGDLARQ
jgi:glutamate dehydrogenase